MPGEQHVPSGEELGAEFQRFLADIDTADDFLENDSEDGKDSDPEDDF